MTGSSTAPKELKTRILVVDDSPIFRNYWKKLIAGQEDIEAVGIGDNGQVALDKSKLLLPDIIIIDLEMPVMDGLTAIPLLMKERPELKIIVASSLTTAGSDRAVEALSRGAADYLAKPQAMDPNVSLDAVKAEILRKIRALAPRRKAPVKNSTQTAAPAAKPSPTPIRTTASHSGGGISAIAIGSSTGGPNALEKVLNAIPAHITQPIFITQHMPKFFITALAQRMTKVSGRPCVEPATGDTIKDGHIYIAPGDVHLVFKKNGTSIEAVLSDAPAENWCRPAVDPMFRSLADIYGKNLLAVILTGMGEDGTLGAKDIAQKGGQIIAQDEATSVVWGMPGAIAKAGLASKILPIDQIGPWIWDRVGVKAELLHHG